MDPALMQKLTQLPELATWRAIWSSRGSRPTSSSTAHAARFGISPATVDNVLYDSYGQRIVSTIYTQSNQYRVILEADPSIQRSLAGLSELYLPSSVSSTNGQVPLSAIVSIHQRAGLCRSRIWGSFRRPPSRSIWRGILARRRVDAIRKAERDIHLPGKFVTAFQGTAAAFQHVLTNQALLLLASIVTMYIVLGVLYESFIHPITSFPRSRRRHRRHARIDHRGRRSRRARIIGIILLIGIVKKTPS